MAAINRKKKEKKITKLTLLTIVIYFVHCPVMTKKLDQNVIAAYWSEIICKLMVKWPKNSCLLVTFFLNKIEQIFLLQQI